MSRPTPRTDSAIMEIPSKFGSICVVRVELALDLEHELGDALRERDEAREALRTLAEHGEKEIQRVTKERDEARKNLRILAGLVAYGLSQSGKAWSLEAMRQATETIQKTKKYELDP